MRHSWLRRRGSARSGQDRLVDDHAILRQGLRALLDREHDLQVIEKGRLARGHWPVWLSGPGAAIVLLDMSCRPHRITTG